MKGTVGDIDEMKIPLNSDTKPIKQQPDRLNLRYKEKVKIDLNRMIDAGIAEPIEEYKWISLMVLQDKKNG